MNPYFGLTIGAWGGFLILCNVSTLTWKEWLVYAPWLTFSIVFPVFMGWRKKRKIEKNK